MMIMIMVIILLYIVDIYSNIVSCKLSAYHITHSPLLIFIAVLSIGFSKLIKVPVDMVVVMGSVENNKIMR
jgi:hypothetical protein